MGTYLENYLESVSSLPSDVRRNFALLRELDFTSQSLIEKVEKATRIYVKNAKRTREISDDEEKAIKSDLKQCVQLGDEKVALAIQTYELVDKHIRRLDSDLKKFEAELEQGGNTLIKETKATVAPAAIATPGEKRPSGKGTGKGSARKKVAVEASHAATHGVSAVSNHHSSAVHQTSITGVPTPADARVLNVDIDMPIDPNEPTYCVCARVSFGEMVGCDSPDCRIEWFHFECVGLTNPPKGKWYCPDCTAIRKKQMRG